MRTSTSPTRHLLSTWLFALTLALAGCKGGSPPADVSPGAEQDAGTPDGGGDPSATLTHIEVTPTEPLLAQGIQLRLTATGIYSDQSKRDLTEEVTWSSSDTALATVSNDAGSRGTVTGVSAGAVTLTATLSDVSGSTTLTITDAVLTALTVTPSSPSLAVSLTLPFKVTGLFSDGTSQELTTQVTWATSDAAVATISNEAGTQGLATGVAPGTADISATLGTVTGSTTLTVKDVQLTAIALTPDAPSIPKGASEQLQATATYSDGSTADVTASVTWSVTESTVATVSNVLGQEGLVTALQPGTTTVRATWGSVVGEATLTVTPATLRSIALTPASVSMPKGTQRQFTAMGTYSDDSTQDITQQVVWASSNTQVLTVSNAAGSEGLATAIKPGKVTVTATLDGITGSAAVDVSNATLASLAISPLDASLQVNGTLQYTATGTYSDGTTLDVTSSVTWASSDPAVASISNTLGSQGLATAVSAGTTTISAATRRNGVTASTTLTVTSAP